VHSSILRNRESRKSPDMSYLFQFTHRELFHDYVTTEKVRRHIWRFAGRCLHLSSISGQRESYEVSRIQGWGLTDLLCVPLPQLSPHQRSLGDSLNSCL
jgi:hypothetical protein